MKAAVKSGVKRWGVGNQLGEPCRVSTSSPLYLWGGIREESARATQKAHEEILEAIRSHDPEASRRLMLAHLQDFEKRLRRWLATQEQSEIADRARRRPARTG